jgi:hypothetical protein
VQIELSETGHDFVMAMIQLNQSKLGPRGNDGIDLCNLSWLGGFGVAAAQGADKSMSIGHISNKFDGLVHCLSGRGGEALAQTQPDESQNT